MIRRRLALTTSILLALATPAIAQDDDELVGPGKSFQIEGHGGMLRFDGEGWEPSYGARAALHFRNGLGIGASATMAKHSVDFAGETEDVDALIATAEILYLLPSASRANFYGLLGGGIARFDATEAEIAAGGEDATEITIPVGGGILWYNHAHGNWLAIRAEVRDNIVFLRGDTDLGTENAIANDWELSLGLALLFGNLGE